MYVYKLYFLEVARRESLRFVKTVSSPVWKAGPIGDPTRLIDKIKKKG